MWENTKRFCNLPEAIIRKFELKHIWKKCYSFSLQLELFGLSYIRKISSIFVFNSNCNREIVNSINRKNLYFNINEKHYGIFLAGQLKDSPLS